MGLSAVEFRKLARDCFKEAELSNDAYHKRTLFDIARLYTQTALQIEAGHYDRSKHTAA
jgi:hypothetical protein